MIELATVFRGVVGQPYLEECGRGTQDDRAGNRIWGIESGTRRKLPFGAHLLQLPHLGLFLGQLQSTRGVSNVRQAGGQSAGA